jgi:NAD(P)-dependent dehydrogenase (short-subunit alcohol dehydrogenase family)
MKAALDKGQFGPWALVTGASSGIGKEFTRQIAASGINVVLGASRDALLSELGRAISQEFDVQYRALARAYDTVYATYRESRRGTASGCSIARLTAPASSGRLQATRCRRSFTAIRSVVAWLLEWHARLQLLDPVEDDDHAGRRGRLIAGRRVFDHQKPLAVRRHVIGPTDHSGVVRGVQES